jgi:hypothetical protein
MRDTGFVALRRRGGDILAKTALPCGSTVQLSGKSGWLGRTLRSTPKKNHPVQIVRKMPLAYDNPARKKDRVLYFRSKAFVKVIFFSLVRPIPVGIRRLVGMCLFTF